MLEITNVVHADTQNPRPPSPSCHPIGQGQATLGDTREQRVSSLPYSSSRSSRQRAQPQIRQRTYNSNSRFPLTIPLVPNTDNGEPEHISLTGRRKRALRTG